MTPKEKAKELFDKIVEIQLLSNKLYYPNLTHEISKQCALIAVEEILEELKSTEFNYDIEDLPIKYWQEVKQEILEL